MDPVLLPHIDEHATNIAADSDAVWAAVILTLRNAFSGALGLWFAGLVGAESKEAADWSNPVSGSTLPGFKVEAMERPTLITLTGRHRFSEYALIFRMEEMDGHRILVRKMLRDIKRKAEEAT